MSERPKRLRVDVRSNCSFERRPDGMWEARFDPLDVRGAGSTEDEAFESLTRALGEKLQAEDDARARWQAYVAEWGVEEEVPEDEVRAQQEMIERAHAASAGFPAITSETFDAAISSATPTLVDFWAEWCMPCHMLAPVLKEVADALAGRMRVAKCNVDDSKGMWERHGIGGIPTMILFRDGRELHRVVGAGRTKEQMLAELEPHVV